MHGTAEEEAREALSAALVAALDDPAICRHAVFSGAVVHVIALGETGEDTFDLLVFADVMAKLVRHEELVEM